MLVKSCILLPCFSLSRTFQSCLEFQTPWSSSLYSIWPLAFSSIFSYSFPHHSALGLLSVPPESHLPFPSHGISSVQFSRSVVSDSLRPHESQHGRPPCPSPTPGVHPDSLISMEDLKKEKKMCYLYFNKILSCNTVYYKIQTN